LSLEKLRPVGGRRGRWNTSLFKLLEVLDGLQKKSLQDLAGSAENLIFKRMKK
jgi:hypothetical protein